MFDQDAETGAVGIGRAGLDLASIDDLGRAAFGKHRAPALIDGHRLHAFGQDLAARQVLQQAAVFHRDAIGQAHWPSRRDEAGIGEAGRKAVGKDAKGAAVIGLGIDPAAVVQTVIGQDAIGQAVLQPRDDQARIDD